MGMAKRKRGRRSKNWEKSFLGRSKGKLERFEITSDVISLGLAVAIFLFKRTT